MSYLNPDQMADGNSQPTTVAQGSTARVILTEYKPFQYGPMKDRTMPKHLGKDADSGTEYEFVGFAFHEAVKAHNEDIVPGETVLSVECLDNGTKYPDYSIKVLGATKVKEETDQAF